MTPKQIKALPLGTRCTYTARITRLSWCGRRCWRRTDLDIAVPCIYIGWRTLSEGVTDPDPEEGYVYSPDCHFDAALVVYDPRCRPVFVPFDALEVVQP
jgi:hypothetical protein